MSEKGYQEWLIVTIWNDHLHIQDKMIRGYCMAQGDYVYISPFLMLLFSLCHVLKLLFALISRRNSVPHEELLSDLDEHEESEEHDGMSQNSEL